MKILLKKEVCGFRDQCIGPTETLTTPIKHSKKKKKKEMQDPNGYLISSLDVCLD